MLRRILSFLFLLAALTGCASRRVQAQYIGTVGLQTTQQTLATALNCTGAAQTFAVNNLGQTQHNLSIASIVGAQKFQAEIDGIDRQGNLFRVSDLLEMPGISVTRQGSISGYGYFPQVQVSITCSPGTATFTASYSGGFGSNGSSGSYLTAQIDKINFAGAPANATQTDIFQTPFGSSAGMVQFQYAGSSVAGGGLSVSCSTAGFNTVNTALSVTLANSTSLQTFQVPDIACPFMQVQYTTPGGGTTVTAEYVFAVPGISNHATTDPCASGTFSKSTAAFTAAAASTTQIVGLNNVNSIYVCGFQMSQIATAGTLSWVYGSGANCGTGTVVISNPMAVTANQPISNPPVTGYVMKAPPGNALCLATTGAGGTASGFLTYINQSP